jgi:hypothetical protein
VKVCLSLFLATTAVPMLIGLVCTVAFALTVALLNVVDFHLGSCLAMNVTLLTGPMLKWVLFEEISNWRVTGVRQPEATHHQTPLHSLLHVRCDSESGQSPQRYWLAPARQEAMCGVRETVRTTPTPYPRPKALLATQRIARNSTYCSQPNTLPAKHPTRDCSI